MSPSALEKMRAACRLAADTLSMVGERIATGVTTGEIDDWVREFTFERGARPSTLNYKGYPKSICTSVNEVICHGIPGDYRLADGDIVNVDVASYLPAQDGFHGDNSAMFYVGKPSPEAIGVVEVARQALERGVAVVHDGARLGDIGHAIQSFVEAEGHSVVRDYVGHGVGRNFHMPPQVPHCGEAGSGKRLKKGMVFTIEPMVNVGTFECEVLDDDWTVVTRDRKLSAQFEHTVLVTKEGCEVLTARLEPLKNSEDKPWSKLGPLTSSAGLEALGKSEGTGAAEAGRAGAARAAAVMGGDGSRRDVTARGDAHR